MITVTGLYCYPLKGGRGIALEAMTLDRFGPVGDRRWLVVDPDGQQITQREIPGLCLVGATPTAGGLELSAPGTGTIQVATPAPSTPRRAVRVWNDIVPAIPAGLAADAWISAALGQPCHLVHCPDDSPRRTDRQYDPVGSPVSFADGYPILLLSEASVADLNGRLSEPVPMNRFRPNVVVAGTEPYAEDHWRQMTIGGIMLDGVKLCARCTVPTTNQATAERGQEPLRTLATFRKRELGVMFGMNVVHRALGTIRVGDQLVPNN